MRLLWSVISLCLQLAASTEPARADACHQPAMILRASSADEVVLSDSVEGTSIVRLAGIDRPELPNAAESASLIDEAETMLSRLIEGRLACLLLSDRRQDRYGRLLAQIYRDDGLWIQGELLRLGLARVHVTADARPLASDMLAIEDKARRERAGLWRDPRFGVRSAAGVGRALGSFQLVEGRVVDAARRGDRWYLNFGEDWRSDFTVTIPAKALSDFAAAKLDPYALKGRVVRVRGWVESFNGPMIEAIIPEQIEVLDGPAP
jgi:endonuclease YncB( thermonuclease family)